MELKLSRICSKENWTIGRLIRTDLATHKFLCATLEDERRDIKVQGETRIPAGRYEILLRHEGGLTEKYKQKFPDMHNGMLWLQNVPNFQWVYIHVGNTDKDTEGCILVGNTADYTNGYIGKSIDAYRHVYPLIERELSVGNQVFITVED